MADHIKACSHTKYADRILAGTPQEYIGRLFALFYNRFVAQSVARLPCARKVTGSMPEWHASDGTFMRVI